jgi:PAS domain S-box-containing protein
MAFLEQKLEKIINVIENSSLIVFRWKVEKGWPIEYVSKNISLFGYSSEELIHTKLLYATIIHKDDIENVVQEIEAHITSRCNAFAQIYRIYTKDHQIRWIDSRLCIIRDETGLITGFQGTISDITEKKTLELEINEYKTNLEEIVKKRTYELEVAKRNVEIVSEAKTTFLTNMSHELRTPMNSIIGFAEILRDGFADPLSKNQQECVNTLMESAHHLLNLINDILDMTKIEAGKMELDKKKYNYKELIQNTLDFFADKAKRHNFLLSVDYQSNTEYLDLDQRKIRQILINLLGNAFKFTPDGGKITISTRIFNNMLVTSISDNGIGISQENQQKLFKPFNQLSSTLKNKVEGTGIGLYLCKQLVSLHGGEIWLKSELNVGSQFFFSIPIN